MAARPRLGVWFAALLAITLAGGCERKPRAREREAVEAQAKAAARANEAARARDAGRPSRNALKHRPCRNTNALA